MKEAQIEKKIIVKNYFVTTMTQEGILQLRGHPGQKEDSHDVTCSSEDGIRSGMGWLRGLISALSF